MRTPLCIIATSLIGDRSLSSSSTRPRTPPSAHSTNNSTPSKLGSSLASPPRKSYSEFLSHTNDDWAAEEDDGDIEYGYDDDEDEFGLPSLSNMRRNGKRILPSLVKDSGG